MTQQYIYPAILYYDNDNENYAVAFQDLDIFTEGETVEDAFKSAKEYLYAYIRCSKHIESEISSPTSFEQVRSDHPSEIVLLVDNEIDDENLKGEFCDDNLVDDEIADSTEDPFDDSGLFDD